MSKDEEYVEGKTTEMELQGRSNRGILRLRQWNCIKNDPQRRNWARNCREEKTIRMEVVGKV